MLRQLRSTALEERRANGANSGWAVVQREIGRVDRILRHLWVWPPKNQGVPLIPGAVVTRYKDSSRIYFVPDTHPFTWTRDHLLGLEKSHLRREESNLSPASRVIRLRAKGRPRCRPSPSRRRSNRWPPGTPHPEGHGHRSRANLLRRPPSDLSLQRGSPRRNNPRGLPVHRSLGPAVHPRYLLANPRRFRNNLRAARSGLPVRRSLGPAVHPRCLRANPRRFRINPRAARNGLPVRPNSSSVRAKRNPHPF